VHPLQKLIVWSSNLLRHNPTTTTIPQQAVLHYTTSPSRNSPHNFQNQRKKLHQPHHLFKQHGNRPVYKRANPQNQQEDDKLSQYFFNSPSSSASSSLSYKPNRQHQQPERRQYQQQQPQQPEEDVNEVLDTYFTNIYHQDTDTTGGLPSSSDENNPNSNGANF